MDKQKYRNEKNEEMKRRTNESVFWIEMLVDYGIVKLNRAKGRIDEGHQLTAIFVASINTARGSKRNSAVRSPQAAVQQ